MLGMECNLSHIYGADQGGSTGIIRPGKQFPLHAMESIVGVYLEIAMYSNAAFGCETIAALISGSKNERNAGSGTEG
jgi:hypothetical protein